MVVELGTPAIPLSPGALRLQYFATATHPPVAATSEVDNNEVENGGVENSGVENSEVDNNEVENSEIEKKAQPAPTKQLSEQAPEERPAEQAPEGPPGEQAPEERPAEQAAQQRAAQQQAVEQSNRQAAHPQPPPPTPLKNAFSQPHNQKLLLEAWCQDSFLSRQILGIKASSSHRLELWVQRFPRGRGVLTLFDAEHPSSLGLQQKATRQVFGTQFRCMLRRTFPTFHITLFSTEAFLQDSLSPIYPRALLQRGHQGFAAIAAPPNSNPSDVLSFGLIWLDSLRQKRWRKPTNPPSRIQGLAIFLPSGRSSNTALRMRWLNPHAAQWMLFEYDDHGRAWEIDIHDCGNLDTRLLPPAQKPARSLLTPEALLETRLQSHIRILNPRFHPSPVYGQVLALAGQDRGILDLLAIDLDGRLSVIELKASESIHLPLQALDYWMRVCWHLEQGDFTRCGYFPGLALSPFSILPPKLLFVAPALRFHSTHERILRYLHPRVPTETIGIALDSTGPLRLLFRQVHRPS
ncbi:MAG: hypothetical protein NZV14_09505 [Bryobacteraceae bacterium]|nr:hypothetical protein [Bryobacteraceae bacterium]MDW8378388.1 hypothetical protein [Bryobacterales bacterium]